MNIIQKYINRRTERRRRERDLYIESLIQIEERAGQMWLTCDGHAILSFNGDDSSGNILNAADTIRAIAVAFDRHESFLGCDFGLPQSLTNGTDKR